jgi:hypothetical protein
MKRGHASVNDALHFGMKTNMPLGRDITLSASIHSRLPSSHHLLCLAFTSR